MNLHTNRSFNSIQSGLILNLSMTAMGAITLPTPGINELHAEARAAGYSFIDTLLDDWSTGENRFDGPGEILMGAIEHNVLVAVGGLNLDPFAGDPAIGRIRRVYVRFAWRNLGIGRTLVTALIDHARQHFRAVRLRAENPGAARLYQRIGFLPIEDPSATHILPLSTGECPGTKSIPPA
ncbi:MAG TPA: GNAT family N-acetyltransferase [Acidobacteriaceae bacterium]|jgi:GNAT superfamily N-acetyltransferase|nr:GNAT family N-acetyltransferase [Acidobacteriaceae bacterium]